MRQRVARSRELVAEGYRPSAVARVAKISRQALYRAPKPRRSPQRRPPRGPVEEAIVEVARANPTDGYRMVWALTRRKLGVAVNRKRELRVMREQGLIQRRCVGEAAWAGRVGRERAEKRAMIFAALSAWASGVLGARPLLAAARAWTSSVSQRSRSSCGYASGASLAAKLQLTMLSSCDPGRVPIDAIPLTLPADAFERVLGRRPLLLRTGGPKGTPSRRCLAMLGRHRTSARTRP